MSKHERTALPSLDGRRLLWKTALLNVGIILSGLATSACLGGPATFPAVLVLLASVSLAAWVITFSFLSSALLLRILVHQGRRMTPPHLGHRPGGVGDEWMDGPP